MDEKERKIFKILEKWRYLGYNELKRKVVDDAGEMSEKPFRETLKSMVGEKLVLRIETETQKVLYSVDFDDQKYETEFTDYFEKLFKEYDENLNLFYDQRQSLSKLEQAEILLDTITSLHLMKVRFDEVKLFTRGKKMKKLEIELQNLIDANEAIIYYPGNSEGEPEIDIINIADNLIETQYIETLHSIRKKLSD